MKINNDINMKILLIMCNININNNNIMCNNV